MVLTTAVITALPLPLPLALSLLPVIAVYDAIIMLGVLQITFGLDPVAGR